MQAVADWHKAPAPVAIHPDELEAAIAKVKSIGSQAFRAGKVADATEWFSKGLKLKKDAALYSNRSACYSQLREYEKALLDADRCLYLSPGWGKGYARRGAALHGLRRYADAIAAYEEGLRMDPSFTPLVAALDDARRAREKAGGDWDSSVGEVAMVSQPIALVWVPDPRSASADLVPEGGEGCLCINDARGAFDVNTKRDIPALKLLVPGSGGRRGVLLRTIPLVGADGRGFHDAMEVAPGLSRTHRTIC
jgi:tetratricopeptide (TPR) repeat protein